MQYNWHPLPCNHWWRMPLHEPPYLITGLCISKCNAVPLTQNGRFLLRMFTIFTKCSTNNWWKWIYQACKANPGAHMCIRSMVHLLWAALLVKCSSYLVLCSIAAQMLPTQCLLAMPLLPMPADHYEPFWCCASVHKWAWECLTEDHSTQRQQDHIEAMHTGGTGGHCDAQLAAKMIIVACLIRSSRTVQRRGRSAAEQATHSLKSPLWARYGVNWIKLCLSKWNCFHLFLPFLFRPSLVLPFGSPLPHISGFLSVLHLDRSGFGHSRPDISLFQIWGRLSYQEVCTSLTFQFSVPRVASVPGVLFAGCRHWWEQGILGFCAAKLCSRAWPKGLSPGDWNTAFSASRWKRLRCLALHLFVTCALQAVHRLCLYHLHDWSAWTKLAGLGSTSALPVEWLSIYWVCMYAEYLFPRVSWGSVAGFVCNTLLQLVHGRVCRTWPCVSLL